MPTSMHAKVLHLQTDFAVHLKLFSHVMINANVANDAVLLTSKSPE